ncbi:hypothetical protein ACPOL_6715 [Acidisarcina polymorpha]|uniref:Uncharacterized protein n=1 Tax=Acidisarcina polymorpha TaxID=2211140 RepID=A0A2Z5GAM8_9BACT|nr:hypothetical protein ACPOL_6715 [Acidisarcina polymorpha]
MIICWPPGMEGDFMRLWEVLGEAGERTTPPPASQHSAFKSSDSIHG